MAEPGNFHWGVGGVGDKCDRCLTIYIHHKRTYIKLIVCKLNVLLLTHLKPVWEVLTLGFISFTQIEALDSENHFTNRDEYELEAK